MWCFPQRIVPNQGSIPPIGPPIKRRCLMQ
nr:MAG TPA: hypothetical protein [Caudoviricetes sp.]